MANPGTGPSLLIHGQEYDRRKTPCQSRIVNAALMQTVMATQLVTKELDQIVHAATNRREDPGALVLLPLCL